MVRKNEYGLNIFRQLRSDSGSVYKYLTWSTESAILPRFGHNTYRCPRSHAITNRERESQGYIDLGLEYKALRN